MKKFTPFLILSIIGFLPVISIGQVTPGSADNFITVWNTQETNEITILTEGEGYNYDLYWEEVDNASNNGELLALNGNTTLEGLNSETEYRVEITGNFPRIHINNDAVEREKLIEVSQWGTLLWSSMENAFFGCKNMDVTATDVPNLSMVNSFHGMFRGCLNLVGDGANWEWNTSTITDMSWMFTNIDAHMPGSNPFNQDIGNWDVSAVTDMSYMFCVATSFDQDIGNWDMSNVSNMEGMFYRAFNFNQDIGSWDVSSVTTMDGTFRGARFFNQDIGRWDVSNVTTMSKMFKIALNFNQDIGDWDVSGVTNMEGMFKSATSFNMNIGDWDVSNVTNMDRMFSRWDSPTGGSSPFNQDIGRWDVSNVTSMESMFRSTSAFNQDIGSWDVSSVTTMRHMFEFSSFNQDIGAWDVGAVTDLSWMFFNARSFNQDIGEWDVSSVVDMNNMFFSATSFNQDIGRWDVSNVTIMWGIFLDASSFNQDIGEWDVSNVEYLSQIFHRAESFNQDIGGWDVSGSVSFNSMFAVATSFNQDLSSWDLENAVNLEDMFRDATSFNQDLGDWDISNVRTMNRMLNNSGLDCSNYSTTLIGWANQPEILDSVRLEAEGLMYGSFAVHARDEVLISDKGWDIRGDALDDDCVPVSTSNLYDDFPGIAVFPNPATDLIRLSGERELGSTRVEIYNTTGVKMGGYTLDISPEATIDISKWSAGVYIIRISLEDSVHAFRFLKL